MNEMSNFESRSGSVKGTAEEVFNYVTDIRHFEQFIPHGNFNNWKAERESCSFSVPMVGDVIFRIAEKENYSKVVFNGDALKKNDFSLTLHISDNGKSPAEVKVSLSADLNPIMKSMAANPIALFLEQLINEMEKFTGWNDIKE